MPEREVRIGKAERLRKTRNRFWSYFFAPDYYASAEIFMEVAADAATVEEKEKYYLEAAETFIKSKEEYGYYRAAEIYKMLKEMHKDDTDISERTKYGALYAERLEQVSKYMLAGTAISEVAGHYEKEFPMEAIEYYTKATNLFIKNGSCTFQAKKAREKVLVLQLSLGLLEEALSTLKNCNIKYDKFCIQILSVLLDKPFEDELDNPEENRIISSLINRGDEETVKMLEDFQNDNFLPDHVNLVFSAAIERLRPENNIC